MELIGKNVIVRASVAGVHAGTIESFDPATQTIILKNAYRLWRFYTRDSSGSVSDIAANGLKSGCDHQIGARLDFVVITNPSGLEIVGMTDTAYESIEEWKNG
jgi:hypothetical protein